MNFGTPAKKVVWIRKQIRSTKYTIREKTNRKDHKRFFQQKAGNQLFLFQQAAHDEILLYG